MELSWVDLMIEVLVNLFFWMFSDYNRAPGVIIGVSLCVLLVSVIGHWMKTRSLKLDPKEEIARFRQILMSVSLGIAIIAGLVLAFAARPQIDDQVTATATALVTPNLNHPIPTRMALYPVLPTYTPTPTSTPTDTPTPTPTPTDTSTPTPMDTSTPTPTSTRTPTPEPPPPPRPEPALSNVPDVPKSCFSEGLRITKIEPNADTIPAGSDIRIWGTAQHSADMHFDRFLVEAQVSSSRPTEDPIVGWRDPPIKTFVGTMEEGLLAIWRFEDWQNVFPNNIHTLTVWIRIRGLSGGNARSMPHECFIKLTLNR